MRRRRCPARPAGVDEYGLPILTGGDGPDDPPEDDRTDDDTTDDDTVRPGDPPEPEGDDDDAEINNIEDLHELRKMVKQSRKTARRAAHEAGKYRTQRNAARAERDAGTGGTEVAAERDTLRMQLAFERAARNEFTDLDAAWKLADRELIEIADDGTVTGIEHVLTNLRVKHPFLAQASKPEPNPFAVRTGRTNPAKGSRPGSQQTYDRAALAKRYPALSDRRRP